MENLTVSRRTRPIAIWLLAGVFMIIIQIILGGITRLTDSGLSITEWKPILGAVPPISQQEWQKAFDHYKEIAQYKHLHSYFTLEDFKSIYFWEWLHRLWGRVIGVVFIIPFLIFILQKRFTKDLVRPMVVLFILGGVQGLIGWIMVKSGLNDENLYVSHIRLAIHFILALGLLVYTFWFAMQLLVVRKPVTIGYNRKGLLLMVIVLLVVQLIYGAFMAGLKAASYAPTWPSINGSYFPPLRGGISALVNDPIMVHFIHRNLAYLLFILILTWSFRTRISSINLWNISRWFPLATAILQVVLGIITVLASPYRRPQGWGIFEWNALLHQFVAMLLLISLVFVYYQLTGKETLKSERVVEPHFI
jgi:cytochrome c oxidase assembly protein subunit 15